MKLLNYFRSRDRGWILSLGAVVFALYLPFLNNPLVFDDRSFFVGNMASHYAHTWFHFDLRWLPYSVLGWIDLIFGTVATHAFHLVSMLLHVASVILLFFILREVVAATIPEQRNSISLLWGAWCGALLFALHPVAVYAVGYVVQISIVMATFFTLVMMLTYLRGLLTGQLRWLVFSVAAYFLAVFSKEHSVMMLAVLAGLTVLVRAQIRVQKNVLWATWIAFLVIGLLISLRAVGVFGTPYEPMAAAMFEQQKVLENIPLQHLLSVLTQAGLYFKYLLLWLLPNPAWMSIDMRESFIFSLGAWQGWLGLAAFALYGLAGVWLLLKSGKSGLLGLALLYPWLFFLLEFSSIRVQEPFVLYRSYLWMPGLLVMIPLVFISKSGKPVLFSLLMVAMLFAGASVNRLWIFADNYRLWNDAALLLPNERSPGADRIFFNRAQANAARGKYEESIVDYQRSIAVSPQYAIVRTALGWAFIELSRYDEALEQFDISISLDPKVSGAYYGKAMVLRIRHEVKLVDELMSKACELDSQLACLTLKGFVENKWDKTK